jgi:hypothetical protein
MIALAEIDTLNGRRLGTFDVLCPLYGSLIRPARHRARGEDLSIEEGAS